MTRLELKLYAFSYLLLVTSSVSAAVDLGGLTLRSVEQWDSDLASCGLWKKPRRADGNQLQESTDPHPLSPQQGEHDDTAAHDGDSEAGVWVSPAIALSRRPGGGIRLSTTRDVAAAETLYTVPSAFHFKAAKLYDEEDPDDAELAKAMSQVLLEHTDVKGIGDMNRGAALGEDLFQVLWLFVRLVRVSAALPSSPDPSTTATAASSPSTMSCSSHDSSTAGVMSAVCNGTTSTDDDAASTVISTDEGNSPTPRMAPPLRRITQLTSNFEAHLRLYLHSEGG